MLTLRKFAAALAAAFLAFAPIAGLAATPSFVSVGTLVFGRNIGSLAPAYPASPALGDVAVLQFVYGGNGTSPGAVTPSDSGWTAVSGSPATSTNGPLATTSHFMWTKTLTGTESGTVTLTFTNPGFSMSAGAVISYWHGVNTATPIEAISTNASSGGGNSTAIYKGQVVTTTGLNRLVVMATGASGSNGGDDTGTAAPSGWTKAFAKYGASGGSQSSSLRFDTISQPTAGTVAQPSTSISPVQNESWVTFSFALIPGGGSPQGSLLHVGQ